MNQLALKDCVPCKDGVPPLEGEELTRLQKELDGDWDVVEGHHLEKHYRFPDFREALAFTNRVGELAEEQGHHPDISLGWGYCLIMIHTHAINGLSINDFILAAKIDKITQQNQ